MTLRMSAACACSGALVSTMNRKRLVGAGGLVCGVAMNGVSKNKKRKAARRIFCKRRNFVWLECLRFTCAFGRVPFHHAATGRESQFGILRDAAGKIILGV